MQVVNTKYGDERYTENGGLFNARARNIARDRGDIFFDATEYWRKREKQYAIEPREIKGEEFQYKGHQYNLLKNKIEKKPKPDEIEFARWWTEQYGGEIIFIPKVNQPKEVRTPDFYFVNLKEYFELKTPKGNGRNVIWHQIESVYGKGNIQSENIFIDLRRSNLRLDEKEIDRQLQDIIKEENEWIKTIIVITDEGIYKAFERT